MGTYLESERIGALRPELVLPGGFEDLALVLDGAPQDADQGLPHVPVERIAHKNQAPPPQSLQHIRPIQSADEARRR